MAMTTQQKLDDARDKYHKLLTGTLRVVIVDGDSRVEYTKAEKGQLLKYIGELENTLVKEAGGSVPARRPAGVVF